MVLRPHREDESHIRRAGFLAHLEDLRRVLLEHDRRERPERLAVLDPGVDDVLDVAELRVREDAAVAKGPRAVLDPALVPADDDLLGEQLGHLVDDLVAGQPGPRHPVTELPQRFLDRGVVVLRSEVRGDRRSGPIFGGVVRVVHPSEVGGTDGHSGVTRAEAHVHVGEPRPLEQRGVVEAVQCHAALEQQVVQVGLGFQRVQLVAGDGVEHVLCGRGNTCLVLESVLERAEGLLEQRVEAVRVLQVVLHAELVPAVVLQPDDAVFQERVRRRRLGVSGKAHDLVFVVVGHEAEVSRDRREQVSDGVVRRDGRLVENPDLVVANFAQHR